MPGPQTAGSSGCWRPRTGTTSPLPACTSMLVGGYLIYSRLHLMNEGLRPHTSQTTAAGKACLRQRSAQWAVNRPEVAREAGVKQDRPGHEEITVHTSACAHELRHERKICCRPRHG